MQKTILGHITCPTCGEKMRITHDKNLEPFGYCEDGCGQQLRVGGNPARVREFVKRYQWAGKKPVTVTERIAPDDMPDAGKPEPVTAPAPAQKKVAHWTDVLGVGRD
jgi:hypothetical protein